MTHPHWSYDIGKALFIQQKIPIFSETPEKEPRLTFRRYVKPGNPDTLPGGKESGSAKNISFF
jgi:hypothetical protein